METPKAPDAPPAPPEEGSYIFPPTDKKPIMHFDRQTNAIWVGFRVDKLDYEGAKTWLDACKHNIYMMYCNIAQQLEAHAQMEKLKSQQGNGRRTIRDIITQGLRRTQ